MSNSILPGAPLAAAILLSLCATVHVATGHTGEKFIIAGITDSRDDAQLGNRQHD
jgi:hypothetical protein